MDDTEKSSKTGWKFAQTRRLESTWMLRVAQLSVNLRLHCGQMQSPCLLFAPSCLHCAITANIVFMGNAMKRIIYWPHQPVLNFFSSSFIPLRDSISPQMMNLRNFLSNRILSGNSQAHAPSTMCFRPSWEYFNRFRAIAGWLWACWRWEMCRGESDASNRVSDWFIIVSKPLNQLIREMVKTLANPIVTAILFAIDLLSCSVINKQLLREKIRLIDESFKIAIAFGSFISPRFDLPKWF